MTRIKRVNRRFRILGFIPIILIIALATSVTADVRIQSAPPPVEEQQEYFKKLQLESPIAPQEQHLAPGSGMQQVINGGYPNNLPDVATGAEYNGLMGGYEWLTAIDERTQLISAPGTLSNLKVDITVAAGTATVTFTVMVNDAPTGLEVAFTGASTQEEDTGSISVSAGDKVTLRVIATNDDPPDPHAKWSVIYTGDTPNQSLLMGLSFAWGAVPTAYHPLVGSIKSNEQQFADQARHIIPTEGKIKCLFVELNNDPGTAPDAYTFTLMLDNGGGWVATDLTVTIIANDTKGNNVVNEVSVSAGDKVCLRDTADDTPSEDTIFWFGLTFEADTNGESLILGGSRDNLPTVDTEYQGPTSAQAVDTWLAGSTISDQLFQEASIYNLYMELDAAPAGGDDYEFMVRINDGDTLLAVTIADAATSGNNIANQIAIADWDWVHLRVVPTGGPVATDVFWGMVSYVVPTASVTIRILNISVDGKVLASP